ncbi:MAG: hypothetical protein PHH21_02270 [Candidatus Pacebacteria bacterium]|nr:hypothetical protein [Candidatus Paceibacterota bacterium]
MTFEELFKKAKMDIMMDGHKDKLKSALLENDFFSKEKEAWDWKVFAPSLALSLILVAFSFNFPAGTDVKKVSNDSSFYSVMSNNKNVSPAVESGAGNALQMVDNDAKTVFYFNERNVLVHSEVVNIR